MTRDKFREKTDQGGTKNGLFYLSVRGLQQLIIMFDVKSWGELETLMKNSSSNSSAWGNKSTEDKQAQVMNAFSARNVDLKDRVVATTRNMTQLINALARVHQDHMQVLRERFDTAINNISDFQVNTRTIEQIGPVEEI